MRVISVREISRSIVKDACEEKLFIKVVITCSAKPDTVGTLPQQQLHNQSTIKLVINLLTCKLSLFLQYKAACFSDLATDIYASSREVYFPTKHIFTSLCNL